MPGCFCNSDNWKGKELMPASTPSLKLWPMDDHGTDLTLTIMIRLYLDICKAFQQTKHLDDYQILSSMLKPGPSELPFCPHCSAPSSSYSHNGSHKRHLVSYIDGRVCDRMVSIPSFRCTSCGTSHSLILSLIIPYSSYSLGFLIRLLYARITGKFPSIPALCSHFDISESTFYRIRRRFALDSRLLLDALRSLMEVTCLLKALLSCDPLLLHKALSIFFLSTGHSFLQPCVTKRPKVPLRSIPPLPSQIP